MMRRNSTSRRVHTLSPVSVRPDEIAATDSALSRGGWSRAGVSDMRLDAHARKYGHGASHGPSARENQSHAPHREGAVTRRRRGARVGAGPILCWLRGVAVLWRSNL